MFVCYFLLFWAIYVQFSAIYVQFSAIYVQFSAIYMMSRSPPKGQTLNLQTLAFAAAACCCCLLLRIYCPEAHLRWAIMSHLSLVTSHWSDSFLSFVYSGCGNQFPGCWWNRFPLHLGPGWPISIPEGRTWLGKKEDPNQKSYKQNVRITQTSQQ